MQKARRLNQKKELSEGEGGEPDIAKPLNKEGKREMPKAKSSLSLRGSRNGNAKPKGEGKKGPWWHRVAERGPAQHPK